MAIQKCGNCSAPLDLAPIGSIQRCSYCRTENRILDPATIEQEPSVDISISSKARSSLVPIVAIFASLIGSGVAFNVFSGGNNPNTPNNSGMEQLFKDIKKMPLPSTQGLAPSKISTLEGGLGWSKIDHTGMQGEFSDFDMIKNFMFAEKVAQNWSTDIQIDSIYIDGVKIDGSLDASAREDWSVDYRFYSPTYRETALAMAKVSEEEPSTELRIKFEAGKMIAHFSHMQLVFLKKRPEKDAFTPTCSTKQLLEEAQKSKKFEAAPFYDLRLQYIDSLPRSSKG